MFTISVPQLGGGHNGDVGGKKDIEEGNTDQTSKPQYFSYPSVKTV